MCKFTNEINSYLDSKMHVIALFIDFSKAFDMLNYDILYDKLLRSGIQGPLLELLKNYHKDRYTTVKIKDLYSTAIMTSKGRTLGVHNWP